MVQLPCGNAEQNETHHEAAARELEEETGYRAETVRYLAHQKSIYFEPTHVEGKYVAVLARDCAYTGKLRLDETEDIETVIIPLEQWVEMIWRGKVTDSKSIAVTLLALGGLEISELKDLAKKIGK